MTNVPIADAYLGGICNAETLSGCLDDNAECKDSICQCIVEFSDINGTCKAGKPIIDVDDKAVPSFYMLSVSFSLSFMPLTAYKNNERDIFKTLKSLNAKLDWTTCFRFFFPIKIN